MGRIEKKYCPICRKEWDHYIITSVGRAVTSKGERRTSQRLYLAIRRLIIQSYLRFRSFGIEIYSTIGIGISRSNIRTLLLSLSSQYILSRISEKLFCLICVSHPVNMQYWPTFTIQYWLDL